MASILDSAKAYTPKKTLNIADLDRVNLSWELKEGVGTDKDGKDFEYNYFEVNGIEYRVPNSVLEKLKEGLQFRPDIKFIRVLKQGTGLGTKYSIVVLDDPDKVETKKI